MLRFGRSGHIERYLGCKWGASGALQRNSFIRESVMAALNNANYAVDEVTESRFESRLDEIIEKMIGDDHWKVKIELLDMFLDLFFEPGNKRFENERMVKIKKMIGKYAERLVSKIHDKDPRVQLPAMVMMSFLEPHVLARYVHDITPMLKDDTMRWDACRALLQLEPQVLANLEPGVLARVVEHTITELDNDPPRGEALRQLEELPLVRWRQLFWGERLLWWWGGRSRKPAQAHRRGEKRARS